MARCLQLLLYVAQEEGTVKLHHLEEEGEDIQEGGTREKVGEVLHLFTGRVDTCFLLDKQEQLTSHKFPVLPQTVRHSGLICNMKCLSKSEEQMVRIWLYVHVHVVWP